MTLPSGFQDSVVVSGLTQPTTVAFSPDGRIFVAEKSGLIKVFAGPGDDTPTTFADLRTSVYNYWDRGMSGLALHPNFPQTPYVYVTYTLDAPIGGIPPVWGMPGATSDNCPTPPGPTTDGCVAAGRLSRLQASGDTMVGPEQVLIEAWCQQFPSHSVDSVVFGNDGALYVSAGEGSNFTTVDYGQFGNPVNPCGDPPVGLGGTQTPPGAEGGALRAQSLRRAAGEPAVLNGTVLRVDPLTGQALPDNPLVGSGIPGAERIIAYGLRNPFRIAARPGTNEIWVGDVGWSSSDEINRIAATSDSVIENFGWPCYEGLGPQVSYQAAHLDQCRGLYQQPGIVTAPVFAYTHGVAIVDGQACGTGGNTVSGLAFYQNGTYPSAYSGALFFADYSRNCIWTMFPGADGVPDPNQRANFVTDTQAPVDLKIGPGGDLYYVELFTGTVHRVQFFGASQPPIAVAQSDVHNGPLPLTVHFDGSGSSDPDPGDTITYAWDLDGDGLFNDSTAVAPQFTYTQAGTIVTRLRVTDSHGLSSTATLVITAGNTAPTALITTPLATQQWQVGSSISFSGTASDPEEGTLPAAKLSWSVIMHHCPQNNCHLHPIQDFPGVATGSFAAPDHEYPSYIEVKLTATDSGGLTNTKSVSIYPRTVTLTFQTVPPGLALATGSESLATLFQQVVIIGSSNTISAPSPQSLNGNNYVFSSWSDGGAASHTFIAPSTATTLLASFTQTRGGYCGDGIVDPGEQCDDGGTVSGDCCSATCQIESGPGCPATPTPTTTPTPIPSATPTPSRTATRTATPTATFSAPPTATRTATPSATPTRTATPTASPTRTATTMPTATATPTATPTPTVSASATPTATATVTPTASATRTATPTPTFSATSTATATATASATRTVTATPTTTPSATPTSTATVTPSPSVEPSHQIGGALRYYRGDRPVAVATVDLHGASTLTATSTAAGQYGFTGVPGGSWQIVPHKAGDQRGAVTALDAAYVLEALAGRRVLDPLQTLAADVDGDGVITPADAIRIAQAAVGFSAPFPAAQRCGSDWMFAPLPAATPPQSVVQPACTAAACTLGAIGFAPLASDASGEEFHAVLFGDCTGNWQPAP